MPVSRVSCRAAALAAVAALSFAPAPAPAQPPGAPRQPRVEVALFKYHGAVSGHDSGVKFDVFRGLVEQKIANLRNEVLQDRESRSNALGNLSDVHLNYRGDDLFGVPSDVARWLHNETRVLNVMRGSIVSDDGRNYIVVSRFHLTGPAESGALHTVTVTLPVKSAEFANTRDTHTLVILYALAMEARRAGRLPDEIALFLAAARNIIADLERRSGALTGDLSQIKAAVERAQAEILNPGRR
jgi:hypothetical protein